MYKVELRLIQLSQVIFFTLLLLVVKSFIAVCLQQQVFFFGCFNSSGRDSDLSNLCCSNVKFFGNLLSLHAVLP